MEGAAAAAIVGTAISVSAKRKAAKAEARAASERAEAKRKQAYELLDRFEINKQVLQREGKQIKSRQTAAFTKGGIDVGTGTPLHVMEDTNLKIDREIINQKREAEWKADALMRGADIDLRLAGDIKKASDLETMGSFLNTGARLGMAAS